MRNTASWVNHLNSHCRVYHCSSNAPTSTFGYRVQVSPAHPWCFYFLIKKLPCTWFTVIKGSFIWLQGVSRFSCYSFTIKTVDKSLQAQHHSWEVWIGKLARNFKELDELIWSQHKSCVFFLSLPSHLSYSSLLIFLPDWAAMFLGRW